MKNFIRPGDRVVVKPNIGWDRSPEQAANTNPIVVKALVEQVLEAGASRVLVFDRTCNEERRCYKTAVSPMPSAYPVLSAKSIAPPRKKQLNSIPQR